MRALPTPPPALPAGPGRSPETAWRSELETALGCPVHLTWTRARTRVISTRRSARRAGGPALEVRLASYFLAAPPEIRSATVAWLRSGRRARRATRALDAWVASIEAALPPRPVRAAALRPRGRCHDLQELALELQRSGLLPELDARSPRLTWGRSRGSRARRGLRLGSCDPSRALIRIHPVLDQPAVPRAFVRLIVFHELLHLAVPPTRDAAGRRTFHGQEFRRRERALAGYRELRAWEEANVDALLRSARTGRDIRPVHNGAPVRPFAPASDAARGGQLLLFPN